MKIAINEKALHIVSCASNATTYSIYMLQLSLRAC